MAWIPATLAGTIATATGESMIDRPYKIGDIYSDGSCVAMIASRGGAYIWIADTDNQIYNIPLLTRWRDMKYIATIVGTENIWLKAIRETKE